jgi:micrococcal nuclease
MKRENYLLILLFMFIISNFIFAFIHLKPNLTGEVIIENFENVEEEIIEKDVEILEEVLESGFVGKVIDGDTVIINGDSVRLLGIDADERGYECYGAAKKRLEELVLDKNVLLEKDGEDKDQYERYLRYLILENENINLKLVQEGLAIARFGPDNQKYKSEILKGESDSRNNNVGCKWEEFEGDDVEEGVPLGSVELEEGVVYVCNAGNYMGETKTIQGKVVDVYKSQTDTIFLNFEKKYPTQCFTAVIFKSYINEFLDYENYNGKIIKISGKIEEYNGKPEIILKEKEQIEIL